MFYLCCGTYSKGSSGFSNYSAGCYSGIVGKASSVLGTIEPTEPWRGCQTSCRSQFCRSTAGLADPGLGPDLLLPLSPMNEACSSNIAEEITRPTVGFNPGSSDRLDRVRNYHGSPSRRKVPDIPIFSSASMRRHVFFLPSSCDKWPDISGRME